MADEEVASAHVTLNLDTEPAQRQLERWLAQPASKTVELDTRSFHQALSGIRNALGTAYVAIAIDQPGLRQQVAAVRAELASIPDRVTTNFMANISNLAAGVSEARFLIDSLPYGRTIVVDVEVEGAGIIGEVTTSLYRLQQAALGGWTPMQGGPAAIPPHYPVDILQTRAMMLRDIQAASVLLDEQRRLASEIARMPELTAGGPDPGDYRFAQEWGNYIGTRLRNWSRRQVAGPARALDAFGDQLALMPGVSTTGGRATFQVDTSGAVTRIQALRAEASAPVVMPIVADVGGGAGGIGIPPIGTGGDGGGAGGGGGGGGGWLRAFLVGTLGLKALGAGGGRFGLPRALSPLSLAGFGPEHIAALGLGVAGSLTGAALGGGLLALGAGGVAATGMATDLAGIGQAAGDIQKTTQAMNSLSRAIAVYGRGSRQAIAAQNQLNFTVSGFPKAAQGSIVAAARMVQAIHQQFNQATGVAEKYGAQILMGLGRVVQGWIPYLGKFATQNLAVIKNDIQPFFTWLNSLSGGKGIFVNLSHEFQATLPTAISAATNGFELFMRVVNLASTYTGGFIGKINDFFLRYNTGTGFSAVRVEVDHLINDFRVWWNFVKAFGEAIFAVFRNDAGTIRAIVQYLTQALQAFTAYARTTGRTQIHNLFVVHRQEAIAILQLLGKLIQIFGSAYMQIAPTLVRLVTLLANAAVNAYNFIRSLGPIGRFITGWGLGLGLLAGRFAIVTRAVSVLGLALKGLFIDRTLLTLGGITRLLAGKGGAVGAAEAGAAAAAGGGAAAGAEKAATTGLLGFNIGTWIKGAFAARVLPAFDALAAAAPEVLAATAAAYGLYKIATLHPGPRVQLPNIPQPHMQMPGWIGAINSWLQTDSAFKFLPGVGPRTQYVVQGDYIHRAGAPFMPPDAVRTDPSVLRRMAQLGENLGRARGVYFGDTTKLRAEADAAAAVFNKIGPAAIRQAQSWDTSAKSARGYAQQLADLNRGSNVLSTTSARIVGSMRANDRAITTLTSKGIDPRFEQFLAKTPGALQRFVNESSGQLLRLGTVFDHNTFLMAHAGQLGSVKFGNALLSGIQALSPAMRGAMIEIAAKFNITPQSQHWGAYGTRVFRQAVIDGLRSSDPAVRRAAEILARGMNINIAVARSGRLAVRAWKNAMDQIATETGSSVRQVNRILGGLGASARPAARRYSEALRSSGRDRGAVQTVAGLPDTAALAKGFAGVISAAHTATGAVKQVDNNTIGLGGHLAALRAQATTGVGAITRQGSTAHTTVTGVGTVTGNLGTRLNGLRGSATNGVGAIIRQGATAHTTVTGITTATSNLASAGPRMLSTFAGGFAQVIRAAQTTAAAIRAIPSGPSGAPLGPPHITRQHGGWIPGHGAVPIIAHGGEYVLTREQAARGIQNRGGRSGPAFHADNVIVNHPVDLDALMAKTEFAVLARGL